MHVHDSKEVTQALEVLGEALESPHEIHDNLSVVIR